MLKNRIGVISFILLILSIPLLTYADDPIDLDKLVNKKWYILAMKCPGGVEIRNQKSTFMQYYFSLELKPAVYNNFTKGTFTKFMTDEDTNPKQEGRYKIAMDEMGRSILVLSPTQGKPTIYNIKVVDENYLTLIRISDSDEDRCRVHYAIAP